MKYLPSLFAALMLALPASAQRFVKIVDSVAAMVALNPNDIHNEVAVKFLDTSGAQDTGGIFYYLPLANDATNTTTVFKPTLFSGRWIRANAPSGTGGGGTNGEVAFVDFNPYYFRTNVPTGGVVGIATNKTVPHWINVKDPPFNAPSDGTDATSAFVSAYDSIKAYGGTLYIPYSTNGYLVNLVITNDNITLLGDGADIAGSTNNALRPFNTSLPVIQIGNDTRNVLGTRIIGLGIIAQRGSTNCPGALHLLGGAFNSRIFQTTFLGGSDTVKFQAGTSFPSTLNKFSQCSFWEGTNSTLKAVYPASGSFTTGNTFSDCYVNGHNSSGYAAIIDRGTPLNFVNTYFDMADNHGFYLTNGPSVHFQNCPVETTTGVGLFTIDARPGTHPDRDLTRYVEGDGNDFQGTIVWMDSVSTNSYTIPGTYGWHGSGRYGVHFRPTLLTGSDFASVADPYTNVYSITVDSTNATAPLTFFRTSMADPRFEFQGTNILFQFRGSTNVSQIVGYDFYPLAGGDTGTAGIELFRNTSRTNSLYLDIHQGINGFARQTRLSANGDSWLNSLAGNVGVGIQTPSQKLHVDGSLKVTTNIIIGSGSHNIYAVLPGSNMTSVTNGDGSITLSSSGGGSGVTGPVLDAVVYSTTFAGTDEGSFGQNPDATTYGPVVFNSGATPLQITLPDAATYEVLASFYVYQPSSFEDTFKLYNSTAASDVTSETLLQFYTGQPALPVTIRGFVTTVSPNNVVQIYGKSGDSTYGSHYVVRSNSWVSYHNLGGGVGFYANGTFNANANLTSSSTGLIQANSTNITVYPTNITDAQIASGAAINATKIGGGAVDNTEFGSLNGVTSGIQAQIDSKSDVSHTHAFGAITTGTNNNGLAAGNFKFTVAQGYQIETLTGVTPSLDWSTQPRKVYAPTTNATYTFANSPSDTNVGKPMWVDITNAAAFSITNTYPAAVRWESDIAPNVLASGKTLSLNFIYNGREIKGFYNTTQTNALGNIYGGSGLNGSTNGDLFTGNTGGSAWNVVKHPGSNGKMLYSTNASPYWTVGDAPTGGASLPSQDVSTMSARLVSDGTNAFWASSGNTIDIWEDWIKGQEYGGPFPLFVTGTGDFGNGSGTSRQPGIQQIRIPASGDTAEARTRVETMAFGGGFMLYETLLQLDTVPDGADDAQHIIGFTDLQNGTWSATNGCYFIGSSTNANWVMVSSSNGVSKSTATSIPLDTTYRWFRITMAAAGNNVTFYSGTNYSQMVTNDITGSHPDTNICTAVFSIGNFSKKTVGAGNDRRLNIDLQHFYWKATNSRP